MNHVQEVPDHCDRIVWKGHYYHLDNVAQLRAELAAAQLDAARYRWLRDKSQPQNRNGPGLYWYLPRFMQGTKEEQLDAAIDNATKEEGR